MFSFRSQVIPKLQILSRWTQFYRHEATFDFTPPKLHIFKEGPVPKAKTNKEECLKYYDQMHVIRKMERSSEQMYKSKIVRGFCHLYSGQEAICVGLFNALRPQDGLITSYRAHGWTYLFNNFDVQGVLSELTGKVEGVSRGKGGSMHMYGRNFYGGNGIVGAQGPLGAGIAFANAYLKNQGVCFALYGDGASNQGQIFEVFNMTKLYNTPCIFVCENNLYGMGTPTERSTANPTYHSKGDILPGLQVDGMDVFCVRETCKFAIDYALKNGPVVMEIITYRYSGHSLSDPGTSYRTREEVQKVRQTRDPILLLKSKILEKNLATEEQLKEIEKKAEALVKSCETKAINGKEPAMEELTADIYAKCLEKRIRGVYIDQHFPHKNIMQYKNK